MNFPTSHDFPQVSAKVFRLYCRACGMCPSFWVFTSTLLVMGARVATNVWLSEWSNDLMVNYTTWTQSERDRQRNIRLGVYGALGCGQGEHGVYGALGCGQGEHGVMGRWDVDTMSMQCIGHWDVKKLIYLPKSMGSAWGIGMC